MNFVPLRPSKPRFMKAIFKIHLAHLKSLSGFEKKGRILKMLSKLKQLCNHPALYLKEPFDDAQYDGKSLGEAKAHY